MRVEGHARNGGAMAVARLVGLAIIAAIAVVVGAVVIGTDEDESSLSRTYDAAVSAAIAEYELNNELAESAPQQQVVNGWIARDLLEVIALQNVELLENQDSQLGAQTRTNGLLRGMLVVLVLGVIAIAVRGISIGARRGDRASPEAPQPHPPEGKGEPTVPTATTP